MTAILGAGLASSGAVPSLTAPEPCAKLQGVLRDACVEASALPRPGSGDLSQPDLGGPVDAPLSAARFQPVELSALASDPAAFLHRPLAIGGAQCFYFGVGDYRCVLGGDPSVLVAAAIVIPPEAETAIEHGCAAPNSGLASDCASRIMFVPNSFKVMQIAGRSVVALRTGNVMVENDTTHGTRAAPP